MGDEEEPAPAAPAAPAAPIGSEVAYAKCWAISVLVFSIFMLLFSLFVSIFAAKGIFPLLSAVAGIVGASMLICCGPQNNSAKEAQKELTASIVLAIGGLMMLVGALLTASANLECIDGYYYYYENPYKTYCYEESVVLIGGFGLAGSGLIAGPLALATVFFAKKAHGVLKAGDGGTAE